MDRRIILWPTARVKHVAVGIQCKQSPWLPVKCGVGLPRGSVFGPTLLVSHVNDINDNTYPFFHIAKFADDTKTCLANLHLKIK